MHHYIHNKKNKNQSYSLNGRGLETCSGQAEKRSIVSVICTEHYSTDQETTFPQCFRLNEKEAAEFCHRAQGLTCAFYPPKLN